MKNLFRLLVIFLCLSGLANVHAQAPSYAWGKSWGTATNEPICSIELDTQSNVYVAGRFRGTIDFDPGPDTVWVTSGTNGLRPSVYIMKLDRDGQFLWIKVIDATLGMDLNGIVRSPDGNFLVVGTFTGEADFDPGPDQFLITANAQDAFLMKMDPDGNFLWAKAMGGSGDEYFTVVTFDTEGNIVTGGLFFGTADLDPGPGDALFTFMGHAADGIDIFAAKYSATGDYIWGRQFPGDSLAFFNDLIIDAEGNLNYLGAFYDIRDFDPGPDSTKLMTAGQGDMFMLKLNPDGDFQRVLQIGGTGDESGNGFVQNEKGDFLIAGYFNEAVDFDPGPGFQLSIPNQLDAFLLSLDQEWSFEWLYKFGGNNNDFARGVRKDPAGNLYLMGYFADTVDFDFGPEVHALSDVGHTLKPDAYILKLDPAGNYRWAYQLGGPGADRGGEIRFGDGGKEIFFTGLFEQKALLSPGLSGTDTVSVVGARDVFITKWTQCDATYAEVSAFSCGTYYSPSGNYSWNESGTYLDTIPNKAGCDSIITIHLTVSDLGLSITQLGDTLYADGGVKGFFWLDCDHGFEQVATGPQFIPSSNGHYAVSGSGFVCTDTSTCFAFVMTATEETKPSFSATIYPNPADGYFYIDLHRPFRDIQVNLFNQLGTKVFTKHYSQEELIRIEMEFPSGVYFIDISSSENTFLRKLIMQ